MTIMLATDSRKRRMPGRAAAAGAAGIVGAAGLALFASTAGASTVNGVATITSPGTTTALASGGSTTQFSVTLPAQASCTGDTSTQGYHVYSYLVQKGTALSGVTFNNFPSQGYGLLDTTGTYYGPANTAATTGQIIGIPNNFEWGPLVTTDGGSVTLAQLLYSGSGSSASGIWEAGLVCANSSNAVTDNWNTEVTFAASAGDPNGFTWSAVPGVTTTTTTTTTTTATAPTSTTTTTSGPGATTTTTLDPNATTTTTLAGGTGTGTGTGGSSSSTSGVDASATSPTGSGGTLAYTGMHTAQGIGAGLLAVGLGLMLLGWGYRKRIRSARQAKRLG